VAHVLALRATPWFDHLVVDPEYYDAWAQRIAAGDWMGDRTFYMDPFYPYVLGALYAIVGRDLLVVRLVQVALSAIACVLVARLGRRVGGPAVGLLAAVGFALYEPEIFYVAEIDKTCLSVLLAAATLVLALGRSDRARFGAGVALGLAALTRANLLVMAPLGVVALLIYGARRHAALFAAGVALALAPVVWRNHHVSGEWVLTTAQAGQNFYTGNNPTNPWGAYGALPFVRGNPHFEETDFRAAGESRAGHALAPGEVSRFWFAEGFRHMREHPAFAARAMLRKLVLFWNDFEISDNQDQYLLERESWVLRLPLLGFGWLAALAVLGAIAAFRTHGSVRLLVAVVGVYCVSVVAFFIFSRYRIQVVPALLPLAALGATTLLAGVRAGRWANVARGAGVVACVALFSFHSFDVFARDNEYATEMRLRHLGEMYLIAGQPERAIAAYQEAIARCPLHCRGALEALTEAYLATGRRADAEAYLRRFTREHPEHPDGARHLARVQESAPGG